jgi:hypothetical protein
MLKAFLFVVLLLFVKIFLELFDQSGEWYYAVSAFATLIALLRVGLSLNKQLDNDIDL